MKKLLSILILAQFTYSYSQISVTKTVEKKKEIVYDSTYNFPGEKIKVLIGQKLFLKPRHKDLQKYGYDGFILDHNKRLTDYSNVYKKMADGFNTEHDSISGKTFKVLNVLKEDKYHPILKLKDEFGEELFYEYSRYESSFPFIVMGYFDKIKKDFISHKYILRSLINDIVNVDSDEKIIFGDEKLWKIVDVTLDDKYYLISFVLFDGDRKILVYMDDFLKKSISEKDYLMLKKKYPKYYKLILKEKVKPGMSEEAVIFSWGKPKDINKSSYSNQWVYDGQYLYFEKGILKSFN